eukprot:gene1315-1659_t
MVCNNNKVIDNPLQSKPSKKDWRQKKWFTFDEDENDIDDEENNIKSTTNTTTEKSTQNKSSDDYRVDYPSPLHTSIPPSSPLSSKQILNSSFDNKGNKDDEIEIIEDDEDGNVNSNNNKDEIQEGVMKEKEEEEVEEEEEEEENVISNHRKGNEYELLSIETLYKFGGMNLKQCGGRGDKGIDFKGSWKLPSLEIIDVIGQCKKYEGKKVGPSVLREFESTLNRYIQQKKEDNLEKKRTSRDPSKGTIGIIVSHSNFTPSIRTTIEDFQHPIAICQIIDQGITLFSLNQKARLLLPNLIIAKRPIFNHTSTPFYTLELLYKQ